MADALGVLGQIIDVGFALKSMIDGVKANKKKCLQLVQRTARITEVLSKPSVKNRLQGLETPQVLYNLQEIMSECEDFITSYGNANFLKKFLGWSGVNEDFADLNERINQCVMDTNLLITVEIKENIKVEEPPPSESVLASEGADVLDQFNADTESSLLIWIDHNKSFNTAMISDIARLSPNTAVIQCETTDEMKQIFLSTRSLKINCIGRCRIITNRARPNANGQGFNEKAAQEVRDYIRNAGYKVPIVVYTSTPEKVKEINEAMLSKAPYNRALHLPELILNFALMSTILWVGELDETISTHYQEKGIVVEHRAKVEEAFTFLYENGDLKNNRRFRIVINRWMSDFAKNLRSEGWTAPFFVWTSQANAEGAKKTFADINRVIVGHTTDAAKQFGLMQPLPGESANEQLKEQTVALDKLKLKPAVTSTPTQTHPNKKPDLSASSTYPPPKPEKSTIPCPNVETYGRCDNQSKGCPYNHDATKPAPKKDAAANINIDRTGTLNIFKISCKNLEPKDSGGTSDPYVKMKCGLEKAKTSVIKTTLNPEWNNRLYRLKNVNTKDMVSFTVWDWDAVGSDDFEGQVEFEVAKLHAQMEKQKDKKVFEFTYYLQPRPGKNDKVSGTITIEAGFV
eukprot:TRINITY_DN862_c0_g1_i1.p1 TRINITY_DN862_c0_g1~~TRINITY_DN862_c0_g1_i1.p1  ORF type:complete len:629 (+),score=187.07 TRINITY_DN862_c0_g1_i1:63-1949(+)